MMRIFGKLLTIILFLVFSLLSAVSVADEGGHVFDIKEVVSASGITAWLLEDSSTPAISLSFYMQGRGAVSDPLDKRGGMNLLAHLLNQGAGDLDSQAFEKRLNDLSVRMDFSVGRDNFYGSMRSLRRYWRESGELLRLSLTSARLDADDFQRVKKVLASELRQAEKNPTDKVGKLLWRYALADSTYAEPPAGTSTSLSNLSLSDIKERYQSLSRQGLFIGVAGNISAVELGISLDRIFADLPMTSTTAKLIPDTVLELRNAGKLTWAKQDIPQSQIAFLHSGIGRDDPDFFTAHVLNYIVGGSVFSSRLGLELREKRGLAYSVNSGLYPLKHIPLMLGWMATRNENTSEAIALIKSIWKDAATGNFTKDELHKARQYLLGSFVVHFTNTQALANLLAFLQREGYERNYFKYRTDKLNAITIARLNQTAKRLFKPNELTFAVVGNPKNLKFNHQNE